MYTEFLDRHLNRTIYYRERIDEAWDNLISDMDLWRQALVGDTGNDLALYHIEQFQQYATAAFEVLAGNDAEYEGTNDQDEEGEAETGHYPSERADFRAMVVGVFTSQWLLLREVAMQRVAGSPYRDGLQALDQKAELHYRILRDVIGKLLDQDETEPLAVWAPMVYLGESAELTVFNRRIPVMLSIPFGAVSNDETKAIISQLALTHEMFHAILAQVPQVIVEIQRRLTEQFIEHEPSRRRRLLFKMAVAWTEEIFCDLGGTALSGLAFARSARRIVAGSESSAGMTDETHPPAILRPVIHLLALDAIGTRDDSMYNEMVASLSYEIQRREPIHGARLSRQFRSVPALMFVSMFNDQ